ncbi:MAG: iron export ABC transporter permease subunit FetB [Rhodospirillaceae bacterium]|nr:iron export ABC transporter permease subunit FetB [Rhodospirillaceae bacterium]
MNFIALGYEDLTLASLLLLFSGLLSMRLKLNMERQIGVAALRMVIQLMLIGMVLKILFAMVSPLWTGLAAAIMIAIAGREAAARQTRKFTGWWTYGLGPSSLMLAGSLVTVLALTTQIRPEPWFDPRFALPILGMILGNTMSGVSIGLDRLLGEAVREKVAVEARLALGHDRASAFRPLVRNAVRAGLMNIINAMSVAGVVSIPGMMTGQILAGVDPTEAVKYQILIMFLIAGSTALGTLAAVVFATRRLSDNRHRLRLDHLRSDIKES